MRRTVLPFQQTRRRQDKGARAYTGHLGPCLIPLAYPVDQQPVSLPRFFIVADQRGWDDDKMCLGNRRNMCLRLYIDYATVKLRYFGYPRQLDLEYLSFTVFPSVLVGP